MGEETLQVETTLGKEWIRETERDVMNSTSEFERLDTPYIRREVRLSGSSSLKHSRKMDYLPIQLYVVGGIKFFLTKNQMSEHDVYNVY